MDIMNVSHTGMKISISHIHVWVCDTWKKVIFLKTVLIEDEMYLQKGTHFHNREYTNENEGDELYKGIMVFMITGLRNLVTIDHLSLPLRNS